MNTCAKCDKLYAAKYSSCPHCNLAGPAFGMGCATVFVVALMIGLGFMAKSCSDSATRADAEKQAQLDIDIAREEAENRDQATAYGVSVDQYLQAKAASSVAWADCRAAASLKAKYDAKIDWTPSYNWSLQKNRRIAITGDDVRMQNGFGVYGPVSYTCIWDMDLREIVSLQVSED